MANTSRRGASLEAWKRRRLHRVTGPSGQVLRIELLGVARLLETDALPEDLIDLAVMELTEKGGATGELARRLDAAEDDQEGRARALDAISRYGRLQKVLATRAIEQVEIDGEWIDVDLSALEEDELAEFPEDDLAMVAEIVQRLRTHDAAGVRVGVEPLDRWATFRRLHGCGEDCEGCEELVRSLSSADGGGLL